MSHEDAAGDRAGRKTGGGFKREQESTMNRTGEDMRNAANQGGESMRRSSEEGLRTGQEAVRAGRESLEKALEVSRDVTRDMSRDLGKIARRTTRSVETLSKASTVLIQGMQEVSREWMGMTQDNLRRGTDMLQQMSQVKSFPDMLDAQADMMRESLQQMIESARRIGEISVRAATEASDAVRKASEETESDRAAA